MLLARLRTLMLSARREREVSAVRVCLDHGLPSLISSMKFPAFVRSLPSKPDFQDEPAVSILKL